VVSQLVDLLKVRARTIDDIVRQATPYLKDDIDYDPDAVAKTCGTGPDATADVLAPRGASGVDTGLVARPA